MPEDNKPGSPKTAILGDEIWRRDFNADPNIVGQSVTVNGKAATIIGVMPPGFKFPISEELWTPLYNEWPLTPRGELFLGANNRAPAVMGRLKPGVTLDQANAEMITIARNIAKDNPKTNQNFTSASVTPLLNAFTGVQLRQIVWAMLGAVILVLLIACVNVMNMQFGRAALRAKELAIRGALGATRWRLVRQMLTESLVVAIFGAIAGSIVAYWGVDLFDKVVKAAPFPPPYWWRFTIDQRVLIFALLITLLATVISGLLPAFLSSRGNAAEADEGRWARQQQSSRECHYARAGGRTNCAHRRAPHRRHVADQIDPQPDQARLRLRRERPLCRAPRLDGRHLSDRRFAPPILHPRCPRVAQPIRSSKPRP